MAKPKDGSILLRWAPTNSMTWLRANKNGYYVERFVITRKNEILKKPEKILLSAKPLKPKPLEHWRSEVEKNDYSAVAAQAIYGSSFQATIPQNGSFTDIANRSKEQEQRFSFALFAADCSFETARLSALAFKDSTAKKDERYLYRVYVANQDSKIKLDTGIFYLGLQDTVGLTPPLNLTAQFGDRAVLLRWPKSFAQQSYTSFVVERSEAGGDFVRRNSSPYINATSADEKETFFQVVDSLPRNGLEYQYRVRGITPFGEIGPESERVSGTGYETLAAKASVVEAKEERGKIYVRWSIVGNHKIVAGYFVERASDLHKTFQELHEKPLSEETKDYIDQSPLSTGYYRIRVLGQHGQSSTSFPVLVQMVDSIPPSAPQGLKVKIDTTGIAKLSWAPNHEIDLLGYKIYRSNFAKAEFSEVSHSTISDTYYSDSVNVKSLTAKVFYKLAAFDKRMNRSFYSAIVECELPDILPPQPPTIKEIRPESSAIEISWNPSPSEDLLFYELERKNEDSIHWRVIKVFSGNDSVFRDDNFTGGSIYEYRLRSIDKNNLKSIPSNSVQIKAPNMRQELSIKDIALRADRENKTITLSWKYSGTDVEKYLIYRAEGERSLSLYKAIPGTSLVFVDEDVRINNTYAYRIKTLFSKGYYDKLSELAIVKF
ncbi:MAG TPA: hypothetical protein VL728_08780 [Cyclobacteriaceae bacterium]|nr:hypothetical protein [Cyclobacteriaceae bacterium]